MDRGNQQLRTGEQAKEIVVRALFYVLHGYTSPNGSYRLPLLTGIYISTNANEESSFKHAAGFSMARGSSCANRYCDK